MKGKPIERNEESVFPIIVDPEFRYFTKLVDSYWITKYNDKKTKKVRLHEYKYKRYKQNVGTKKLYHLYTIYKDYYYAYKKENGKWVLKKTAYEERSTAVKGNIYDWLLNLSSF